MNLDDILHRLQTMKDGGYVWLAWSGHFYRWHGGVVEQTSYGTNKPDRITAEGLQDARWLRSGYDIVELVANCSLSDYVIPLKPVPASPPRHIRKVEL